MIEMGFAGPQQNSNPLCSQICCDGPVPQDLNPETHNTGVLLCIVLLVLDTVDTC